MPAETKTDLGIQLGKAITEFRNKLRQFIHQKFKEHQINLTFEMLEVLSYLWKKNGMNQQEIADLTLKDKSSITYLIDNLVKRNLVTRVEDESDRRNKLIFLTREAEQLREQLHPWVNEMYGVATHEVSADEMLSILDMITKMTANLS